jgi:hypothetical protein
VFSLSCFFGGTAILAVFSRAARRATLVAAGKPVPRQETAHSIVWLNTFPQKRESTLLPHFWIPVSTGMTISTMLLSKQYLRYILAQNLSV